MYSVLLISLDFACTEGMMWCAQHAKLTVLYIWYRTPSTDVGRKDFVLIKPRFQISKLGDEVKQLVFDMAMVAVFPSCLTSSPNDAARSLWSVLIVFPLVAASRAPNLTNLMLGWLKTWYENTTCSTMPVPMYRVATGPLDIQDISRRRYDVVVAV